MPGTLKLTLNSAKPATDSIIAPKSECYVLATLGDTIKQSRIIKAPQAAGQLVSFNQQFEYHRTSEAKLKFEFYNKGSDKKEKLLGVQELPVSEVITQTGQNHKMVDLLDIAKKQRTVQLTIVLEYREDPKEKKKSESAKLTILNLKGTFAVKGANDKAIVDSQLEFQVVKLNRKTKVAEGGGANPKWKEIQEFIVDPDEGGEDATVTVTARDVKSGAVIGTGNLRLSDIVDGKSQVKIELKDENKKGQKAAGYVQFECMFDGKQEYFNYLKGLEEEEEEQRRQKEREEEEEKQREEEEKKKKLQGGKQKDNKKNSKQEQAEKQKQAPDNDANQELQKKKQKKNPTEETAADTAAQAAKNEQSKQKGEDKSSTVKPDSKANANSSQSPKDSRQQQQNEKDLQGNQKNLAENQKSNQQKEENSYQGDSQQGKIIKTEGKNQPTQASDKNGVNAKLPSTVKGNNTQGYDSSTYEVDDDFYQHNNRNLHSAVNDEVASSANRMMTRATIEVQSVRAYIKRQTDGTLPTSQSDQSYLVLRLGDQMEKSSVNRGGGKKPQWHDQFRFNLSNEDKLDIELWESDANAQDNLVGSGQLLIAPFLQGGKFKQQKCKLKYNGAEGAEVFMDIECQPNNLAAKIANSKKKQNESTDLSRDLRASRGPSVEDLRKKDLLAKRKELMRPQKNLSEISDLLLPILKPSRRSPTSESSYFPSMHSSIIRERLSTSLPRIEQKHKGGSKNKRIKKNYDDPFYRDRIFGIGYMNSLHSATSLQRSVPTFSVPAAERFKNAQGYQGIDSFFFTPPSDFGAGNISKKIAQIGTRQSLHGISKSKQAKGFSFGIGQRTDFTHHKRELPGPGEYGGPLLKDRFSGYYGYNVFGKY